MVRDRLNSLVGVVQIGPCLGLDDRMDIPMYIYIYIVIYVHVFLFLLFFCKEEEEGKMLDEMKQRIVLLVHI